MSYYNILFLHNYFQKHYIHLDILLDMNTYMLFLMSFYKYMMRTLDHKFLDGHYSKYNYLNFLYKSLLFVLVLHTMFHKLLDYAEAGDNIGALLRGIQRTEIERGQVLSKPGTINPHTKFKGQVYVLTKDEGGRHTPFFNNYRPQFYFRTTDVTGVCELPAGTEMCMPGDNVEMTIELIHPIAMEQGLTFAIREGGRTVGSGRVATIIE